MAWAEEGCKSFMKNMKDKKRKHLGQINDMLATIDCGEQRGPEGSARRARLGCISFSNPYFGTNLPLEIRRLECALNQASRIGRGPAGHEYVVMDRKLAALKAEQERRERRRCLREAKDLLSGIGGKV